MLNTIFADNKSSYFPRIQANNYKDITLFGISQLRHSLSPNKIKTSKKFFYSIRNNSNKNIQNQEAQHHQLESLIRKQKIILMSQRTNLNDLIVPQDVQSIQAQIMGLPTIDIRKVSESYARSNYARIRFEKRALIDLIDFRDGYESNILRNKKEVYQTLTNIYLNFPLNNQNSEQKYEQKIMPVPKIINERASSELQHKQYSLVTKASQGYSLSKLSKVKSTFKIQQKSTIQKKYKKGFLSYEAYGHQRWQKIKNGIQKTAFSKIQNHTKVLTAKNFYVYDIQANQPIVAYNGTKQIEIASLSKIMTCYLSILICIKYEIDMKNCYYRVSDRITETPGTSAQLAAGDLLNVQDLLYGLMLPSGNDASICLAELMGKVIQRHKKKEQKYSYFQTFISQMNAFSKELDLNQQWRNSSGLSYNPNFSTAQAITALSALAIKNQLFRKIVTTKQIQLDIKNDRYGLTTKKNWKNTNRLLQKGWQGVKTGTTETAGHCLISKRQNLIISVFDCQTMSRRFTDSIKLYDYIQKIRS